MKKKITTIADRLENKCIELNVNCENHLIRMSYLQYTTLPHKQLYIKTVLPEMKIAEFANSVDLDEVAHPEPPHLDLYCLPSSL